MTNALKFTKQGNIEYGYQLKDNYIEFFVKDTGIGMSERDKQQIFNYYAQGVEGEKSFWIRVGYQ